MDKVLTLVEHLSELRKRILISLVSLGAFTAICFPSVSNLIEIFKQPARGVIEKLFFFSPQEAFMLYMRIAVFCGFVLSLPIILYQVLAFIAPALEKKVKRFSIFFIIVCSAAFFAGCYFAFFFLIPPALKFLLGFAKGSVEPLMSGEKYISFVIGFMLCGGLVFQMPVLSYAFTRIGIINHGILRRGYKYAVVIIVILAAIITPTSDAFNMLILAAPMLILYEFSIWVSFAFRIKPTLDPIKE